MRPSEIDALVRETNRRFIIHLHVDRRPRRWFMLRHRPWWATLVHGIAHVGDAGGGVWHARTRAELEAKMRRKVADLALCRDIADPVVRVDGPTS